jgi:hypothetical protein
VGHALEGSVEAGMGQREELDCELELGTAMAGVKLWAHVQ